MAAAVHRPPTEHSFWTLTNVLYYRKIRTHLISHHPSVQKVSVTTRGINSTLMSSVYFFSMKILLSYKVRQLIFHL